MPLSNVTLHFHGFHPSESTREAISDVMQEVRREAPDNALVSAHFVRRRDVIKATLNISSSAGPFFASATGPNLDESSRKLVSQIRRRLGRWRDLIQNRDSIKNIDISYVA